MIFFGSYKYITVFCASLFFDFGYLTLKVVKMTDIKVSRLSDEDVIQLIIDKGKTNFFSVLYDRYSDKVYRKCLSFEKDKDVALDLSHDILIKVFLQLSKFQGRSRFSTWLYSVAYNYCVEYTRKKTVCL